MNKTYTSIVPSDAHRDSAGESDCRKVKSLANRKMLR